MVSFNFRQASTGYAKLTLTIAGSCVALAAGHHVRPTRSTPGASPTSAAEKYSNAPRVTIFANHALYGSMAFAALRELAALGPQIRAPEHTLISAQHGAEWWTAWFLHTHIAHGRALRADDWRRYDVLFLQVKAGFGMPMMGPGGRPGPGGLPPGLTGPPVGPPGMPGGRGPMPPGGGGGPMMALPIPADAQIIYDGPNLKLARVLTPPASVGSGH